MTTDIDHRQLDQLAASIASLCSGKYSDLSIRCADGTIIPAHRAVVCPRSRVLAAAVDGKFQEAISQEIYLEDDEPSIVGKMIDFFYKLDYDDHRATPTIPKVDSSFTPLAKVAPEATSSFGDKAKMIPDDQDQIVDEDQPEGANPVPLQINAQMYIIADKYEIQALKDLAVTKYKQVSSETWNSSAFTESALLVYNNTVETDRMLRDVIVEEASKNVKTLLDCGEFVKLLKGQSDLAVEVLRKVVSNHDSPTELDIVDDGWGGFGAGLKKKKRGTSGF